jgi:helix-turn-helix protein
MSQKSKKQIPVAAIAPVPIPADAIFLTARELAGLLRKTSLKSVYRLAKKNLITHVHESGGLLFARKSVDEYLAARLVSANEASVSTVPTKAHRRAEKGSA